MGRPRKVFPVMDNPPPSIGSPSRVLNAADVRPRNTAPDRSDNLLLTLPFTTLAAGT
jgi:hypothetical protein